jgi:uncharacterized protein YndB with AHSA1/START domain
VDLGLAFRALSDPTRRLILDRLFERDGQSIHELGAGLEMGRFGVAKHLRLLEKSGLVSARRVGRQRRHYLNPVPIQQIYERWVSKYAAPWARVMTGLKSELEAVTKPKHVYHVFIRATPEAIWRAITDGEWTQRYFYGMAVESEWRIGLPYAYRDSDGRVAVAGEILETQPPRRLVQTFQFTRSKDAPSRLVWEIEPMGETCRLTLVHEFDAVGGTYADVDDPMGWQFILSGLKSVLETDRSLVVSQ